MYEDIKEQFKRVIAYSQGNTDPQIDKTFDKWYNAKSRIIRSFGDLIYEVPEPVAFRLGEAERISRAKAFVETVENNFGYYCLGTFILNNIEGFYENKTVVDYEIGDVVVKAGSKLVRAFKHFVDDEVALAKLQTEASMLIQEDKVEGILCFSVHPLDFISSSETTYNWRSCHALDGEYRCGNLSYMCDETTIICYLKGEENKKLPRFPADVPWNSKKWRMLITYDQLQQMIFAGRQYPFFSEGALDIVWANLTKALRIDGCYWSDWHDDYISQYVYKNNKDTTTTFRYYPIGDRFYRLTDLIVDRGSGKDGCPLHFNDLLRSSCYTPFYKWNKYTWRENLDEPIKIGGTPYCIQCGRNEINYTDSMYCADCELEYGNSEDEQFARCGCCDSRFESDDGEWTDDGTFICPTCAKNECYPCEVCGRAVFKERAIYSSEIDGFICPECMEDR